MKLLTEALLKRHLTIFLIHSGKPQRNVAPIVSMLFDLSIPQSRGSIAMAEKGHVRELESPDPLVVRELQ